MDRYKGLQSDLSNRFADESTEQVEVKGVQIPDLSLPESLGRQDNFSLFITLHQQMADVLISAFMGKSNKDVLHIGTAAARVVHVTVRLTFERVAPSPRSVADS